jgi:hypothetical protein
MAKVIDLAGEGGGVNSIGFTNVAQNYTALSLIAGVTGQLSYVIDSEGTAWLPGTLGGSYYPSGIYVYDGANWVSDRNAISQQLQINIDDIDALEVSVAGKLDTVVAGTNITVDNTDPNNPIISSTGGGVSRNNYVLVKSKSDFPTPSAGVITLADNTDYEINGIIALGTDRIVAGIGNKIYGITALKDKITSTVTGAAMITSTNNDFVLLNMGLVSSGATSEIISLTGSGTNKCRIDRCLLVGSTKIGSINGGFQTLILDSNVFSGNSDGLYISGTNEDLFFTDNLVEGFIGTATAVSIQGTVTYHTIIISRNMWEIAVGQIGLDIDANISFTGGGLISENSFEDGGNYLNGIDASSADWDIPSKANIGIAGLRLFEVTMVLQSWTTTSATYLEIPETQAISNASFYEPNATTIKATISSASVSHDTNGQRTDIELFNLTDGTSVVGSEIQTTITSGGVFQVVNNGGVFYDILPNKEYRVRLRRGTGTGQNEANIRSCTIEIEVY